MDVNKAVHYFITDCKIYGYKIVSRYCFVFYFLFIYVLFCKEVRFIMYNNNYTTFQIFAI